MKPNTRFLRNIVSSANSHNAALLAKETAEARARLRKLDGHESDDERRRRKRKGERDGEGRKSRRSEGERRHRDDDRSERRHKRSRDYESDNSNEARERRKRSRDYESDSGNDDDRRRRHRSHRSHRSHCDDRDEERSHKRRRRDEDSDEDDEEEHRHKRSEKHKSRSRHHASRSRSPEERRKRHSRRSPEATRRPKELEIKSRDDGRLKASDGRHSRLDSNDSRHKSSGDQKDDGRLRYDPDDDDDGGDDGDGYSNSEADERSDSEPDDFGPRLASDPVGFRIKGRGARSGASAMDRHFEETYDPAEDVEELLKPEATKRTKHFVPARTASSAVVDKSTTPGTSGSTPTTEDARAELAQDRQSALREGAKRLRKAGFTDKEIAIWARGGKRGQRDGNSARSQGDQAQAANADPNQDIQWAAKGTAREWDRGKVAGEEGRPRPDWAR